MFWPIEFVYEAFWRLCNVCSRSAAEATAAAAGPERNLCAQKVSVCVFGTIFEASKIRLGNGIFGFAKSFSLLYMQTHLLSFYSDMATNEGHHKIHCRSCIPYTKCVTHTYTHVDGRCLVACITWHVARCASLNSTLSSFETIKIRFCFTEFGQLNGACEWMSMYFFFF